MLSPLARERGLKGRVALITGAGGGIGRGIARCLAEEGVHLALADISKSGAEAAAEEIRKFDVNIIPYVLDVTDKSQCADIVDATNNEMGSLDIVVNNAGVIGGADFKLGMPLSDINEDDWDDTYNVNVKGVFLLCQASLEKMKGKGWGRIINISSRAGRDGRETIPHYSASKAAVIIFTQALAREVARAGITVNAVCPGLIWSAMWEQLAGQFRKKFPIFKGKTAREVFEHFVEQTPMGVEQSTEDIGRAVAFLASDDAKTITGQAILVDSGAVMH
ncbi:MAG: SDR family NAD(P)-dependent oxidoreductase [Nitrospinae bacterium]|nr:SDR family NAD(P)-dependent oxidoreductase [Nitrospinota bacterium]